MADQQAAERAIADFLRAVGHPPESSPHLKNTPERVAKAWLTELLAGEQVDTAKLLKTSSELPTVSGNPGWVVLRHSPTSTTCPHHLMPASGYATVGYLPGTGLTGLGTLARLVDAHAQRLRLQEDIGTSVVADLCEHLGARFAFCQLYLRHACLCNRGPRKDAWAVSVATRDAGGASAVELSLLPQFLGPPPART